MLINFLSAFSKMAIWLTHKNQAQSAGSVEPVPVLEGLLKSTLKVEYAYYRMIDNVSAFSQI